MDHPISLPQGLTEREQAIIRLVAQGYSDREIAQTLSVALDTVKWYNKRIYAKLDAQNRTQAATRARALGFLNHSSPPAPLPPAAARAEPVATPPPARHNLPAEVSSFVGRRSEIAAVRRALAETRLLTLTGIGGSGKTRLALAVARESLSEFADGVHFVPLAPISAPESIIWAVAEHLHIQFDVDHAPLTQLIAYFHTRSLLLVLDNFDHLLAGAGLLTSILEAAPNVKMLVTSREWLNVYGEAIFPVDGLAHAGAVEEAASTRSDAEQLFLKRAHEISPGQRWSAEEMLDIGRVCRLVDGMPLAIELAATWVDTLSPLEIAAEIEHSLDILEVERRDLPESQRSVRAAFDRSWKQLDEVQRAAFRRLSVFRGGFTREAGEAICGVRWRTLHGLVSKSLLRRNPQTGRFEFHELLRHFAQVQIEAAGEVALYRRAHAQHYADFMAGQWAWLKDRRQQDALRAIEADMENVRSAWKYWIDAGDGSQIDKFAHALWAFCDVRGWYLAAIEMLRHGIHTLRHSHSHAAQASIGWMLALQGLFSSAGEGPARSDTPAPSWMQQFGIYVVTGYGEAGYALAREGVGLLEETQGHDALRLIAWYCLFVTSCLRDEDDVALQSAQECLMLATRLGDGWSVARAQQLLAIKAIGEGDLAHAEQLAHESLLAFETLGDNWSKCLVYIDVLSLLAVRCGHIERARQWLHMGLEAARSLDFVCAIQKAFWQLGYLAALEGNYAGSAFHWREAMQVAEQPMGGTTFLGFGGSRRWSASPGPGR